MAVSKTNKILYILGAGASAASDFKLPCMKGFFDEGFENLGALKNFVDRHFSKPQEEINLEEVVTFLELSIDKFGKFGKDFDPVLYETKSELYQFIFKRLNHSPDKTEKCKKHEKFLMNLGEQDSLITLNYDLILDHTLHSLNRDQNDNILNRMKNLLQSSNSYLDGELPCIDEKDKQRGFLLKLHGSINWFYCPREGCVHNQAFYTTYDGNSFQRFSIDSLCKACGTKLEIVIVPPTMNKSFIKFPKLAFLWSLAFREISQAGKIIIWGVSFAESDYYLHWLIASAVASHKIEREIIVIDREQRAKNKASNLFKADVKHYSSLDDFLE